MTASETCKEAGLDSLAELSELSTVPLATLKRWYKTKTKLFNIVLSQCVIIKGADDGSDY